jgi:hypothetical protein
MKLEFQFSRKICEILYFRAEFHENFIEKEIESPYPSTKYVFV